MKIVNSTYEIYSLPLSSNELKELQRDLKERLYEDVWQYTPELDPSGYYHMDDVDGLPEQVLLDELSIWYEDSIIENGHVKELRIEVE